VNYIKSLVFIEHMGLLKENVKLKLAFDRKEDRVPITVRQELLLKL
jgi:hypothetical protein